MNKLKLLISVLISLWGVKGIANAVIVNCNYCPPPSNYGDGTLKPSDIDPSLCTHLSYTFHGEFGSETGFKGNKSIIPHFMALKEKNRDLKVLLVIGDWNSKSGYSGMLEDANKRNDFINFTLKFIRKHEFDGLNICWAKLGKLPKDKHNFVTLLKDLKKKLGPLNLQLDITVPGSPQPSKIPYDMPNIAKEVDYINVYSYPSITKNDNVTRFAVPLKGQGKRNFEFTINYWLEQGAPRSKLVMGLPLFGLSFKLSNPQQFKAGALVAGPGQTRSSFGYKGVLAYNEICSLEKTWKYHWDSEQKVPFLHKCYQWVGYDNARSLILKIEFGNSLNLAGFLIGPIDADDFRGQCGEKYPLLNAIKNKLSFYECT